MNLQSSGKNIVQEMRFPVKDLFSKCDQNCHIDLLTFTEETLNGKLHFLYSGRRKTIQ